MDYKVCDSLCFRFIGLIIVSRTFGAMSLLSWDSVFACLVRKKCVYGHDIAVRKRRRMRSCRPNWSSEARSLQQRRANWNPAGWNECRDRFALKLRAETRRKELTEYAGFLEANLEQSKSNIVRAAMDLQCLQRDLDNKAAGAVKIE